MISIIIPYVNIDEESKLMTDICRYWIEKTKGDEDEIIWINDDLKRGNAISWNEGIKKAKGDVILLMDNDIEAINWREKMLDLLNIRDIVFPVIWNAKANIYQKHLAGEFWMFRRELIDEIGLLDETYGSYFEDTDFFIRALKAGKKLEVAEDTLIIHRSQGTFSKIKTKEEMKELFEKNKKIYENKFNGEYPCL